MTEIPGPRATGVFPCPLIPIFIPQKRRLRGVLALTGRSGRDGPGRATQVQCFCGWREGAKRRTSPSAPSSPPRPSASGVQCVTEREAVGHTFPPRTSVVQGPRGSRGQVQCLPCVCPRPPQGTGRRGLRGSGHRPAGWAGALLGGEQRRVPLPLRGNGQGRGHGLLWMAPGSSEPEGGGWVSGFTLC